jgi:predicted phage tail component-like protein
MACFVFDGVDYSSLIDVASIEMPALPTAAADLRTATGRDGALLAGNPLEPMTIKVKARLAVDSIDPRDIQRAWALVAAGMRTDGPRQLNLTSDVYRMAVLTDAVPLDYASYSAIAELTFVCPDPVAYGDERTVTVPSGGSATFEVGGTYPAMPAIAASAVRDGSSHVWGIRLDDGDFVHVATGSASARNVAVDCAKRTCTVQGTPSMITTDSDWLVLEPGTHTLAMDNGTGAATVTFVERWL